SRRSSSRLLWLSSWEIPPGPSQAPPDVTVGGYDQVAQSLDVQFFARAQLHMTHALALALQQAPGIREHGAIEEADIGASLERIDISNRCGPHTSDRTSVVQELADIGAAAAHALKPCPRHQSERIGEVGKPSLNPRVASDRTGEPQQIVHLSRVPVCPASVE